MVPILRLLSRVALLGLFGCCLSSAQSVSSPKDSASFEVKGIMVGPRDSIAAGVRVQFDSDSVHAAVKTDNTGAYSVELPFGLYKMRAQPPPEQSSRPSVFQDYVRPPFLVLSRRTVILNGSLYFARPTCDIKVVNKSGEPITSQQMENSTKSVCGGQDVFSAPSSDGMPFEVYFQYPKRHCTDGVCTYVSDKMYDGEEPVPVFVAYNLFSLEASKVVYDTKHAILTATGHVVVADASGNHLHFESATFKIENGQAVPTRELGDFGTDPQSRVPPE